jgi:uracil-DNA glycosylase
MHDLFPDNWMNFIDWQCLDLELIYSAIEPNASSICPAQVDWFKALKLVDPYDVKVVIVGQDPYHGKNEANGLAFSVNKGIPIPPSLRNIFKEIEGDVGLHRASTDLSDWAKQGVLLLNSILTVNLDQPASHKGLGWEQLTDDIIASLSYKRSKLVFVLWGNFARSKKELIDQAGEHLILESTHPSPFSANRGFIGSKPFSKINTFLKSMKQQPIKWV